jgi:predicted  nucleic acid-binding Zn-ribbon protein
MLKQKNGLSRQARKALRKVNELKMDLEECNKKALKHGFKTVENEYHRIKNELRKAKEAINPLTT